MLVSSNIWNTKRGTENMQAGSAGPLTWALRLRSSPRSGRTPESHRSSVVLLLVSICAVANLYLSYTCSTDVANYNALVAATPDPVTQGDANYDEMLYINVRTA